MIENKDLVRARSLVMRQADRQYPKLKSIDTTRASVEAGLMVVEFDVDGAMDFCKDIAGRNYERVRHCCIAINGPRPIQLFSAAIASGMVVGAQAERMRK
jgi:hypothetical protein